MFPISVSKYDESIIFPNTWYYAGKISSCTDQRRFCEGVYPFSNLLLFEALDIHRVRKVLR